MTRRPTERPLYPFNAEPEAAFVEKYKGARDVPLFSSPLVVPVFHINNLRSTCARAAPSSLHTRDAAPFAVNINYGAATFSEDGRRGRSETSQRRASRQQFVGWISGESIGHVYP
jgi:hypothetical protein